ncbi:ATP-binding protein [Rhizobium bangladeshense]|uniref:ATP-binding protein n=1 Tax=Rhizobium bangladeshense TaxID=1138189 RepID=A0ABS7LCT3_9HYPH|nr:ATP-binding protein [Rhizobium bangladeshense]MBX4902412.1 ATP-binding protein [Rhizobium bangladeshense]MBY3589244.1 ATP-binding protein [Rhizobium bangladeshense]
MARIKVRARAVDMLGRQQIAGIPTAIHELFKNAHDAYAERVRVDYIHSLDLFVLRDNGLGMTKVDLESKWLTLGTESKVGQNDPKVPVWTGPEELPRRSTLGEKGIGRLAIAAIGPQVLVYSRAVRPEGLQPAVCALVNWSLFEQPGLDLDQIEVPVVELEDLQPLTPLIVQQLVDACLANLEAIGGTISPEANARIAKELKQFTFDPSTVYEALGDASLGRKYGTHFLIKPTSLELGLDLALTRLSGSDASPLQRFLLGFSNTMHGADLAPPIIAEFVEHRRDGSSEDLIGPYAFFTPEEFASADHHIRGSFDEYGTFKGTIRIYDQVEHDYTLAPPDDITGATDCGPFEISFAYVQGSAKDTRMPLDEWKRLGDKLDNIGGLYVYRDGIRILPYGNSDVDWLNIERRRTLSAQDWFFSYRRIIGDVRLTNLLNPSLVEKAGREGFRQNKAYRQMVALLERLFERLALDFFREKARVSTDFDAIRKNKQRDYEILQKRAKSVKGAKEAFNDALSKFFESVRAGKFELQCDEVRSVFIGQLDNLFAISDPIAAGERLLTIESEFASAAKSLRDSIAIARPRQFGLTKRQQQEWQAYVRERDRLVVNHYEPLASDIADKIHELLTSGRTEVDPRRRLDEPVRRESEVALSNAGDARKKVSSTLEKLDSEIRATINRTWSDLSNQVELVKSDLARTEIASLSPEEVERRRDKLIDQVRGSAERSTQLMDSLGDQLRSVMEGVSNQSNLIEVTAALESENDELKERVDQYADLAQIGLALGLVQHEFSGQVRNINRGLDALKPWANRNRGLDDLYGRLRVSFEHLESYLQLFVPLNRRLQRRRVPVSGLEIEEFVRTVFGPRFERHGVELIVPSRFRTATVTTFPSTILPVFANVVDNAIYWLDDNRQGPKTITFEVTDSGLSVSNSGPGIDPRDAEGMFEFGISGKPAGRGMGLYLSRDALRKEGMEISLERAGVNVSPKFIISVPQGVIQSAGGI